MTIEKTRLATTRQARYRRIADQLRAQIAAGIYRAGDRLPTEWELAHVHGVSRVTSAAALALLEREGLVQRSPRRGTVVRAAPNAARASARPLLAWLQPGLDYGFGLDILRSIEHTSRMAGFDLLLRFTGGARQEEEQAIRDAVAAGASAMALWLQDGETYNAEVLRLVVDRFPVVLVDRHLRGVQCACVGSENTQCARALVDLLVHHGHRAICALVFPVKGTSTIEDRLDGYMHALAGAGIPVDHSLIYIDERCSPHSDAQVPEDHVRRFADFLQRRPDVTAIFASNAHLGLLARRALDHLGLQVPEDVSLVSIDGLPGMSMARPTITCAIQPSWEIGARAVELLQEGLAGKPPRRIQLPMRIVETGSVSPPRISPASAPGRESGLPIAPGAAAGAPRALHRAGHLAARADIPE
jgi:DNA-binding LacI/PurR family transcriptional regulator